MMRLAMGWILAMSMGAALAGETDRAPTFQELLDPAMFPNPQWGMTVESVSSDADGVHVRTTGAEIEVLAAEGIIRFGQRIGHVRTVAEMAFGRALRRVEVTHGGPGFARVTVSDPKLVLRVNGDSLTMVHAREPVRVAVTRHITTAWAGISNSGCLIADEWGAFGLYFSEPKREDRLDPHAQRVLDWQMPADAVIWLGVCPPKPYPWERSLGDHVVWHWSRTVGYPTDDTLRSWAEHGNIVLLQAEVMLWKDWNLDFVPRLGVDEFARVRETLHGLGMRFIVYTSPYYFLRGTALESRAMNSFEGFKGFPPGTPTGENMELFMSAVTRVMREHQPDGLYYDGQYVGNPAALYALARRSRELVGEDGILEWHSTLGMSGGLCYLPQADAYVDFVLRGEGRDSSYGDPDYLRFFVSGYNIHNSIGVLCNNSPSGLTSELARDVLAVNGRLHTIGGWLAKPESARILKEEYRAALTPALRDRVDAGVDARQRTLEAKAAARRAELTALESPPRWGPPVRRITFATPPAGEQVASSLNPEPLRCDDEGLHVRAHGHTYAFLRIPLEMRAGGFAVRLRHGTDQGAAWGPGVALAWPDGGIVRIGTRSGGTLQGDVFGTQRHGYSHDPQQWIWLRVRWLNRLAVVERSMDGETYEPMWIFEHPGTPTTATAALLIGKVPFNGKPKDFATPGEVAECTIGEVLLYGVPETPSAP